MNAATSPDYLRHAAPGTTVMELALPPVSRQMLALYAGASGDHVPLHIDTDVARKAGMPDVFAHGMLVAAWLGRVLTDHVAQDRIRSLSMRFVAVTHLYNAITCRAQVAEHVQLDGEPCVRLTLEAANQYGDKKVLGEAVVAVAGN